MTEFLKHNLEVYFVENPDDALKICEQVLVNKRSRETSEKTRLNLKKKLAGTIDLSNRVQKFVDCRTKDVGRREIYIVEGDSALGSCKLGRDAEFQAIIPVRGKILNCLKAEYDKIFKNDIITDIIKVLGCGVEVQSKANKELSSFDLESLKWHRIVICTDADVDGFQIRTLILTMLFFARRCNFWPVWPMLWGRCRLKGGTEDDTGIPRPARRPAGRAAGPFHPADGAGPRRLGPAEPVRRAGAAAGLAHHAQGLQPDQGHDL